VAVVRRSCRKRRSVVESVWRKMFGLLKLHLESVNTFPVFQGLLLLLSEISAFGDFINDDLLALNSVLFDVLKQ
jgi:hypothetical protein